MARAMFTKKNNCDLCISLVTDNRHSDFGHTLEIP